MEPNENTDNMKFTFSEVLGPTDFNIDFCSLFANGIFDDRPRVFGGGSLLRTDRDSFDLQLDQKDYDDDDEKIGIKCHCRSD